MNTQDPPERTGQPPHGGVLAVSIVLYRPDARLERTLETLAVAVRAALAHGLIDRSHLLLRDHSPQAATPDRVQRWRRLCAPTLRVDYRHDPRNPGYGAGHNAAWTELHGADYFLVANPDLEFAADALVCGLDFLQRHPRVGVIAPTLMEADGSSRAACFRAPEPATLLLRAVGIDARRCRRIARYECRDWDLTSPVFNPPHMSGCCLLFRGATFARLGGFDPGFFLYFEDFELSRRAAALGVSAYCPTMRVSHFGGGAAAKGWRHRWWFVRSALRYYLRVRLP